MQRRDFVQLSLLAASTHLLGCGSKGPASPAGAVGATNLHASAAAASGEGLTYFAKFGVDEPMLKGTLGVAMSKGGDYADLFFQHTVASYLTLEDGEINRGYTMMDLGVGVRVVKGDQTGYAFSEDFSPDAMKRAAETAASIADGPAKPAPSAFNATRDLPSRYKQVVPWTSVPVERKLPLISRVGEQALKSDPRIKKAKVNLGDAFGAVMICDSNGRVSFDVQPMTSLGLSCVAEHGTKKGVRETNGYNVAARAGFEYYTDDRLDRVVREAIARTVILLDAEQPAAGEMPVVLAAGASGILLHEAIGHGMEADFNRKNTSIYSDKIGKSIAKPFVNIVDDGTVEHARGAINVDDEGNDVGSTHLVENGVLTTYLHDSISAKHYGVKPTGNGRRENFKNVPMPRMRATYMLPGPHKKDEIIASVKRGIYCANFTNGEVNIGAGDFTFYVKNGYLIEDGKLTRPIKDVNLIGNGPKVLEKIDMVADDLAIDEGGWTCGKNGQSVPVSQGMPTVRVASITVGGGKSAKGHKA